MREHLLFEKIEAYLNGVLPPEEVRSFEQKMADDEELALAVELQRLEHEAMDLMLEKDLKSNMQMWKDNPPPDPFAIQSPAPQNTGSGKWNRWLPLLAFFLVLAGGIYFMKERMNAEEMPGTNPKTTPLPDAKQETPIAAEPGIQEGTTPVTNEPASQKPPKKTDLPAEPSGNWPALAASTYNAPDFSTTQRSGSSEKSRYDEAAEAFAKGQYSKTVELLSGLEAGSQSHIRYLRGHALFNLKKYKEAALEFHSVASSEFAPDAMEARWYLTLAYLAQLPVERTRFIEQAGFIADEKNQHPRRGEAIKLLEWAKEMK